MLNMTISFDLSASNFKKLLEKFPKQENGQPLGFNDDTISLLERIFCYAQDEEEYPIIHVLEEFILNAVEYNCLDSGDYVSRLSIEYQEN